MKLSTLVLIMAVLVIVVFSHFTIKEKNLAIRMLTASAEYSTTVYEAKLTLAEGQKQALTTALMHSDAHKEAVLEKKLNELELIKVGLEQELARATYAHTTITWYHPGSGGINTDGDHYHTATMTTPVIGRTVAISKALVRAGWLGKKVYIEGYGIFVAEDRMSSALSGNRIDICAANKKIAMTNGKKRGIFSCIID